MRFTVLGSYGRSNIGDEAIANGIAKMLRKIDPQSELILFTHDTQAVAAQHVSYQIHQPMIATGLRSFWRQWRDGTWSKSIELLRSSHWVIIGGGGIFHDHEVGQKGLNPLLIWWLRTVLMKFLKKPILIWSVGIGPIQNQSSSFWIKGILKRAHTITVRDQASADLAKLYTNKEITVVPDPVWGSLPNQPQPKEEGTLGISIRESNRYSLEQLEKLLFETIDQILKTHTIKKIILIPFAFHQPDDRQLMGSIVTKLNTHYLMPVEISKAQTIESIYATVASCGFFVAMRFHSYIFAQSAKVPSSLMSYSSKTDEITKSTVQEYESQQQDTVVFWQDILSRTL